MDALVPTVAGTPLARFGGSSDLSADGRTLVVGASARVAPNGDRDGRVHVFTRAAIGDPWELQQTLIPSSATTGEWFGYSVAIDGDLILVGSGGSTTFDDGAAYVFRRTNGAWAQEARFLEPSSAPFGGDFGRAVAISGETLAVSDTAPAGAGRVFIYTRPGNHWARQATLVQPAGDTGIFGNGLALDGPRLAVGVSRSFMAQGGEVRIFLRTGSTWTLEDTVRPDSVPYGQYPNDEFGRSLDLRGATLLAGAPGDQVAGNAATTGRGAAFVFRRSGSVWSQYSRIDPIAVVPHSKFGGTVALAGEFIAAIGAPGNQASASNEVSKGAAFLFEGQSGPWLQRQRVVASDGEGDDYLGWSIAVAASGTARTVAAGSFNWGPLSEGALYSFEVSGATVSERQRLLEPSKRLSDFGTNVAIDGDMAIVGAQNEGDSTGDDLGAAYVFQRNVSDWEFVTRIAPSSRAPGDRFGSRVAVSGSFFAISAPGADHAGAADSGEVYLYERLNTSASSFALRARLAPNDYAAGDGFGQSLALRGATLAAGSPGADDGSLQNSGAAYVFAQSGVTWTQAAKVRATDRAAGDRFGSAVAVVGPTRVIVGAIYADAAGMDSGAAYVFDRIPIVGGVAWTQRTKLTPSGLASQDWCGASVATSGTTVVLGAPGDDVGAQFNAGSAYVYQFSGPPGTLGNTFTLVQQLTDPNGAANSAFGQAIAIDGTVIACGSPVANAAGVRSGKVVIYERASGVWSPTQTVVASAPEANDELGRGVALSGGTLIGGAPGRTTLAGDASGVALAFDLWLGGAFGVNYCTAATNSSGGAAQIAAIGSPLLAANNLRVRATGMPSASVGYFLVSRASGLVSMPGGARGDLCLGGEIGRFSGPGQVLATGANGSFELAVDLLAMPQPAGAITAHSGEVWHFQAWFRDLGVVGFNSGFTRGLAVTVH
ncbi:MAG: FG-GAP repeat protein [Planctomycetota bacterium]